MIGEYRTAFFQLLLGLFALHGSLTFFFWLSAAGWLAVLMTLLVLVSLSVQLHYIRATFGKFRLPSAAVVTGRFDGDEAKNAGSQAGLRDRGEIGVVSHLIQQQGRAGSSVVLG
jgi:hypothetical protein